MHRVAILLLLASCSRSSAKSDHQAPAVERADETLEAHEGPTAEQMADMVAETKRDIAEAERALAKEESVDNLLTLASALAGYDDDRAVAVANRILVLDPKQALAHALLGELLHRRGDEEGAQIHLDRAIELEPRHRCISIGRFASAVSSTSRAGTNPPRSQTRRG